MDKSKKRSRENEPQKASNKKQTTLLSMFKPVAAAPLVTAPVVAEKEGTATENYVESLNVPSSKTKDPETLFKNVDKETRELLDLEIRTMNYEWLKVLAPELVKPYFLKVSLYENQTKKSRNKFRF
jgi:uracil-DNA glycosylase